MAIIVVAKVSPICAACIVLIFVAICQHFDYMNMRNESIAEFAKHESAQLAALISQTTSSASWMAEMPIFLREPFFRYDIATVPERNYAAIDRTLMSTQLIAAPFSA
jgi:hypothetical protein